MSTLFTVGHGTRSIDELVATLRSGPVEIVCDVRRFPGSRRNPHLGREALEVSLPEHRIRYEWWGDELGGRRRRRGGSRHHAWRNASFQGYADHMDDEVFRAAVLDLERRAADERIAVMCAETLWWRCHRRLIADTFTIRGHEVIHLFGAQKKEVHKLHPNVRIGEDGWPLYDVNVDLPLDLGSRPAG